MITEVSVNNLLKLIQDKNIPEEEVRHYRRVAAYALQNYTMYKYRLHKVNNYYIEFLALSHDLVEDGYTTIDEIMTCVEMNDENKPLIAGLIHDLSLLTRDKSVPYEVYISKIRENGFTNTTAYVVKIADMKDHLSQQTTLTEKLKAKYLNALAILL